MKQWIIDKLLKAGIPALVKYGAAWAIAHNLNAILASVGVTVDWAKFQVEVTMLLGMAFEILEEHLTGTKPPAAPPAGMV